MNRKVAIILAAIAGAVLLVVVAYLITEKGKERGPGEEPGKETVFKDMYPDAPNPAEDPELAEQIKNLWPDVSKPKPDRDAIRREWADFAKKYPKNIYIPDEFRGGPLTEEQAAERRKLLDTVTGIETTIASQRGAAKSARPGENGPAAPAQPSVSRTEQVQYFDYKIAEMESRIQLVQYMLENGSPSAEDRASAQSETQKWTKQLEEYKNLKKQASQG